MQLRKKSIAVVLLNCKVRVGNLCNEITEQDKTAWRGDHMARSECDHVNGAPCDYCHAPV